MKILKANRSLILLAFRRSLISSAHESLPQFAADEYRISSFANWIVPKKLMYGRYPGTKHTHNTSGR